MTRVRTDHRGRRKNGLPSRAHIAVCILAIYLGLADPGGKVRDPVIWVHILSQSSEFACLNSFSAVSTVYTRRRGCRHHWRNTLDFSGTPHSASELSDDWIDVHVARRDSKVRMYKPVNRTPLSPITLRQPSSSIYLYSCHLASLFSTFHHRDHPSMDQSAWMNHHSPVPLLLLRLVALSLVPRFH